MAKDEAPLETEELVSRPRVSVPVEYNTRDLLLYSVGIGSTDPRFTYELSPDFAAFPTYPICFTFKGDSFDAVPFPPPVMRNFSFPPLRGIRVGLDAEKYIEKVEELPRNGARLNLVGGLVGVHKKGSGALVEHAFDVVDESGKVYYKIISGSFQVGAQNFKDSGVTHSRSVPPPSGSPTASVEVPTNAHIASIFRLSGDYNPLHVDATTAKMGGFEQPILHGLCTLGHTTRAVLETVAGGDQRLFKSVQMRFASPVIPGQTLLVEMWRKAPTEVIFRTLVKETGKVCISNGLMQLHPTANL
mmetsp:Transcript_4488/g.12371  ORF Transcript_4488/g.12371 Transcript_4488/m.12371 type:complete len:302 (-) Transcript_4488:54-959(-)